MFLHRFGVYGKMLLVSSPAPAHFFERAVATWTAPWLKGATGSDPPSVIVLPASRYDMNNWDDDAQPDSTHSQ